MKPDLSSYNNSWYKPGNPFKRFFWYYTNLCFFRSGWLPLSGFKIFLLRLFGAKIGKGVVVKPHVNIKYPWFLSIGNHVWIGEEVWIDNLGKVTIGDNVCISQGAMLLCGNHNYKKITFDLIVREITLHDGAWVGAKATICPGCVVETNSLITVGSVAMGMIESNSIYTGNPAVKVKEREIKG
ncbi:MAG: WcaF family extracellular polysaccharide biosynthesis acetyltransferase [Flavobacteriales bacterium]